MLAAVLTFLTALAASCAAPDPLPTAAPTPTHFGPQSIDDLYRALDAAADGVRRGEALEGPAAAVEGRLIWVGEQPLEAYTFAAPRARREAQQALLEAGGVEPGAQLWGAGHLLLIYAGDDGGTVLLLSGLLGDSETAAAVQEGPYPPAVTAAIRAVAERRDAAPGRIQVIEFEPVEWTDSCLELPDRGESCDPKTVSGWRIRLRLSDEMIVVHADELGQQVRLR